jgi:hypothetical protein
MMALGAVLLLVAFVCQIIILIDAFRNEIWKGLLCIVCGLYGLYYMFAEFDHEKKALVLLGVWGGIIGGYALLFMGGAMSGAGTGVTP